MAFIACHTERKLNEGVFWAKTFILATPVGGFSLSANAVVPH